MTWTPSTIRGNRLREKLASGSTVVGTFLNLGSALAAEACAIAGYDWLLIDLEHGGGGESSVLGQIHAAAAHDVPVLVRVESLERMRAGRVLDLGANGIMFPQVAGAEDARRAVGNLRYFPRGQRGTANYNRLCGFGQHPEVLDNTEDAILGVIQIETEGALSEANEIAAIDGVDVLFVGPVDLTRSLGIAGQTSSPIFVQALDDVVNACATQGKAAGVIVNDPTQIERFRSLGFTFIAVGSDSSMLARTAAQTVHAHAQDGGAG